MQIFASDPSPYISAIVLDDKRLGKMIIESAQILSSVWGGPYKLTHKNHPAMNWVKEDWRNYIWLFWHYYYLHFEWISRFDKCHAAGRWADFFDMMIKKNGFLNTTGIDTEKNLDLNEVTHINMTDFKHIQNVYEAYKNSLTYKWNNDKRKPKWTNREKPEWYKGE